MSIFGIGPLEFLLILLIAFLVLGPEDAAKQARKFGKFIRKLRHSEAWYLFTNIRYEIEDLPRRLLEEDEQTHPWEGAIHAHEHRTAEQEARHPSQPSQGANSSPRPEHGGEGGN